jgi:heavy metal sensor kinase
MRGLSIRWRLTLWYGAVLAAVLLLFGGSVYLTMRQAFLSRVDGGLEAELQEVADDIEAIADRAKLVQQLTRRFARHGAYEFQLNGARGEPIARGSRLGATALPVPRVPRSLEHLDFESAPLGTRQVQLGSLGRWRVASRLVAGAAGTGTVLAQVAAPLEPIERELAELLAVLLLTGPLALAAALLGGYLLARQALAPVDRMVAAAEQITAAQLDKRLEVPNPDDELGRLATTLNGMIARLERSFDEIRRFTADAAHELRTPLAVMRSAAEVALRSDRDPEQYRRVLEDQLEEVTRMTRLAERLLFLCREDAGLTATAHRPVQLDRVVCAAADHMKAVADARGLSLTVERLDPCNVRGDEGHLRRLLYNLLDNAIKYTPAGGSITVSAVASDGGVRLVVADTGIGIAAEHLSHVFDRFCRLDPARALDADGAGLGLAISQAIARAHDGTIAVESVSGQGTRVTLALPLGQ